MTRGDVYRANLNPSKGSEQSGTRPVIIVSRDAINRSSPVVIIVPVTDRANKSRIYPSHVEIGKGEGGLVMDSVALCEQVRAMSVSLLISPMGHLQSATMTRINAALKNALDLP